MSGLVRDRCSRNEVSISMELNNEARELPEGERDQQRLINVLRERGPTPRRLSANERLQVFIAVNEQPRLLAYSSSFGE